MKSKLLKSANEPREDLYIIWQDIYHKLENTHREDFSDERFNLHRMISSLLGDMYEVVYLPQLIDKEKTITRLENLMVLVKKMKKSGTEEYRRAMADVFSDIYDAYIKTKARLEGQDEETVV